MTDRIVELLGWCLMIPLGLTMWRMIRGPTIVDRIIAIDMLTGLAIALAAMTAATTRRREFLDVGLVIAIIGFVGTCAFAAFIERKGRN